MGATAETVRAPGGRLASLGAWLREHRLEVGLVLPLIVYVLILTVFPIIDTFRISLTTPVEADIPSLFNYRGVFDQGVFRDAVINTVIVALLSIGLELSVGLAVALALHVKFFARGAIRTIVLVPLGVPTIVSGAVMLLVFNRSGYLNSVLGGLADLISKIPGISWDFQALGWTVAGGWRTLLTIAIADMWKVLPIVTLIFLAGLQSIPEDIYEAADVDGATKWQRFYRITLPLLIPYITMAIILRAIDAFRIFELALVIGGPGIEPVLGTYIWAQYGPPTRNLFTSSAASVVLFLIIMVFIVLYLRFVAARGEVTR